jgi:hypothetical protein
MTTMSPIVVGSFLVASPDCLRSEFFLQRIEQMIDTLALLALRVGEKLGLAFRGSDKPRCGYAKQAKGPSFPAETRLE